MYNTIKTSFQIEITYAINSFLYSLQHTPILKNIVTKDLSQSNISKKIIKVLAFLCTVLRMIVGKVLYLLGINMVLQLLFKEVSFSLFVHVFVVFTILGAIINAQLLRVGRKKYYTVLLLKMEAKRYAMSQLLFSTITTFLLNFASLFVMFLLFFKKEDFLIPLLLASFVVTSKIIGESLMVLFYKKTKTLFLTRTTYYFIVLFTFLALAFFLPYVHLIFPLKLLKVVVILNHLLALFSLVYLLKIKDYLKMYKQINTQTAIMNSANADAYNKQKTLEIRKKDYKIDEKKLKGKKGYDYFNTIFFERHKVLLSNSANRYALIFFIVFLVLFLITGSNPEMEKLVLREIKQNFAWIMIIMYFVNRGAIITQAMFYNCDRSMLTFNFYKDPKVILNVFFQRMKTVTKVNLRPALVIGLGLSLLLAFCEKAFTISQFFILLSVLSLSIFFSIHYLVIYYLLQPYNVHMEMKSFTFSLVSFLTYFICYLCTDIHLPMNLFSLLILIITIFYSLFSLIIVYKKAPTTFKLK